MPDYILGWVDIAIEQYLALPPTQQRLIDTRIEQLLDNPAGPGSSHDPGTDLWTTADAVGAGLIVYVFRDDRPRLVILLLVYSSTGWWSSEAASKALAATTPSYRTERP